MKLIKSTASGDVYKDKDQIVKIKPAASAVWEAHVLGLVHGIPGVPQFRALTDVLNSSLESAAVSALVIDYMPGKPLSRENCSEIVIPQIHTLLTSIYLRGLCHGRVTPENILVDDQGVVSLIGFSKAFTLIDHPLDRMRGSPDFTGEKTDGGYDKILRYIAGEDLWS